MSKYSTVSNSIFNEIKTSSGYEFPSKSLLEYEKNITEFDVLTLDYEQERFLYSLLYLATLNDIHLERKLKTETAFMHYLDVLDLKPDATIDDVNRAYKRKAKNFHPDTISSKELDEDLTQYAAKRFREIQEAYQYLKSKF